MKRIITAKEQLEMLAPWMVTAAPASKPIHRLSFHDTVMQICAMADTTRWHPLIRHEQDEWNGDRKYVVRNPLNGKTLGELGYDVEGYAKPPQAYIESIVVHPEYQKRGIGQALIERLHNDYPDHRINPGMTTSKGNAFTERLRQIIPDADEKLVPGYEPSVMNDSASTYWSDTHERDLARRGASRELLAAPPGFDKVYNDEGQFLQHQRPEGFPSLQPAPEAPQELAEPPTMAPILRKPSEVGVQQSLFPNDMFQKVEPQPEDQGWPTENAKTKDGKDITVQRSPNGHRYRVDKDGNPVSVTRKRHQITDQPSTPKDRPLPGFMQNLARFLVPEELERSVMAKYHAADDATKEAGSQWYDTATEYIHNLAQTAGLDPHKVGAIVSAFSPQTSWDQNMAAANYFIMNYDPENPDALDDKMGGLGDNLKRAKRIYEANDQEGYLAGLQNGNDAHKITNFYHNLMGDRDKVTIDSWMVRALLGKGADGLAEKAVQKVLGWKGGYDTMAGAVQSAAKKLGITPRELQAIVWSHVVPTAGSYEEMTPQQRLKKERQRENYINNLTEDSKILPDYFHGPGWRAAPEPTYRNRHNPTVAQPRWGSVVAQRFWAGIQDNKYPQHWMDGAEQLARDTGGFTIHDEPGDGPTSGYQVAVPGYERTDINTGQGWADYADEINPVLQGPGGALGTWFNPGDGLYYTEPSENFPDYDDAARATIDRNQWSMWDQGAHVIDPATGEKRFLPQADIPRSDIAQQGIANSTGFTLAKRGIQAGSPSLYGRPFWKG